MYDFALALIGTRCANGHKLAGAKLPPQTRQSKSQHEIILLVGFRVLLVLQLLWLPFHVTSCVLAKFCPDQMATSHQTKRT